MMSSILNTFGLMWGIQGKISNAKLRSLMVRLRNINGGATSTGFGQLCIPARCSSGTLLRITATKMSNK